ncbi:unnamed protein product, partial [Ixodes pacificus]
NPPWIEIATKAKQRRERKLDNEIGHAIPTVILYGLAPDHSSKILIRRVRRSLPTSTKVSLKHTPAAGWANSNW